MMLKQYSAQTNTVSSNPTDANQRSIYSVSKFNAIAQNLLENHFPPMWIEGEISNFTRSTAGHLYLSLKDKHAQIRVVMFRNYNHQLNFQPSDGMKVLVHGKITLYTERGTFQLIADWMEEAGYGALQRAFEALKKQLHQDGLFDPIHKKPLPAFPRCIGIITSPTGAAIQDILTVLNHRAPMIPVIIYPSQVQGVEAATQLIQALHQANHHQMCDVIILSRGGGSLEDLWSFNEKKLAHAIFQSQIPIISGIGHAINTTIADLTADYHAVTPSVAAEHVTPDTRTWPHVIQNLQERLYQHIMQYMHQQENTISHLAQRLVHPQQRLDSIAEQLHYMHQQLNRNMQHTITNKQQALHFMEKTLQTLSPLNVLSRGYAIIKSKKTGTIITNAQNTTIHDILQIQLSKGQIECEVQDIAH